MISTAAWRTSVFSAMVMMATMARAVPLTVVIDASHPGDPVSKYEYGMFIEPIGGLIALSLWAEMLDDRRFYYPIVPEGRDVEAPQSVEGRAGITYRKWRPIGGEDAVMMDPHNPYVGAQSAAVVVDESSPRGFGQGGIAVVKDEVYSGHILLSGYAGAKVDVALIRGAGAPGRQIVTVPISASDWHSTQFEFTSRADLFLAIDEFAYIGQPANLKMSLAYSMVLQEMLRHTDFLKMGAFTTGVSTLDISSNASVLNSTGEVFRLYGEHFGAGTVPLAVEGNSPQPEPKYAVGFDHPKVRAGSSTHPLDVIAGLSLDRRILRIAVVNATFKPQILAVETDGIATRAGGTVWRLTGKSVNAVNKVGAPPGVTIKQSMVPPPSAKLRLPPISASIYEFPVTVSR
jgi:hypothetical protein